MAATSGGACVMTNVKIAFEAAVLPTASLTPEPAAVKVRVYVPTGVVSDERLLSVNVSLSLGVTVCDGVSRFEPLLNVSDRDDLLKPETTSLNTIWSAPIGTTLGLGIGDGIAAIGATNVACLSKD